MRPWVGAVAAALVAAVAGCGGGGTPVGRAPEPEALRQICANAAARAFGVATLDVLVFPFDPAGGGRVAGGQVALPGNAIGSFQCSFSAGGGFEGITRTF